MGLGTERRGEGVEGTTARGVEKKGGNCVGIFDLPLYFYAN